MFALIQVQNNSYKFKSRAISNDVYSDNNRWLIQVPRLYDIYRANNNVKNFQDIIRNLFEVLQIQNKTESFFYNIYLPQPLFEVTNDPSSHPNLHRFLKVTSYPQCDCLSLNLNSHWYHST